MSKKIMQALLEEFPNWDKEEVAEFAEALVSTVRKFDPQARKFEKIQVTGPKRNLIFVSKALRAARDATPSKLIPDSMMTQKEVAEHLEWSVTKIIRIEAGTSIASKPDIKALAELYGMSRKLMEELIAKRKG